MFGSPHRQHRTRRRPDDAFGDASKKQTLDGRPAVCPNDDQVDVRRSSVGNDGVGRVVGRFNDGPRAQAPPIIVAETVKKPLERSRLQVPGVRRGRPQEEVLQHVKKVQ